MIPIAVFPIASNWGAGWRFLLDGPTSICMSGLKKELEAAWARSYWHWGRPSSGWEPAQVMCILCVYISFIELLSKKRPVSIKISRPNTSKIFLQCYLSSLPSGFFGQVLNLSKYFSRYLFGYVLSRYPWEMDWIILWGHDLGGGS